MKRFIRRRWLFLPGGACGLLAVVALWFGWSNSKISLSHFDAIEPGMTQAEVEAVLGGPARAEFEGLLVVRRNGHKSNGPWRGLGEPVKEAEFCQEWRGREAIIYVVFDKASGRVLRAKALRADAPHPWAEWVKAHLRKLPGL